MEKKIKRFIVIITIIIIIIVALLLYLISVLNKEGKLNTNDEEIYLSDQDTHFRTQLEKVTSKYDFFDTITCINKYMDLLQKLDISSYEEQNSTVNDTIGIYKQQLYDLIDKDYIKQYNLTMQNIDNKFSNYYKEIEFNVEKMYVLDAQEDLAIYFVYGNLIDVSDKKSSEYGFIVKRDTKNLAFTILPYDYMLENKYNENEILNKNLDKIKNTTIEAKDTNLYTSNAYDNEYISEYYFNVYKTNLETNVDAIYNKLDKEYREKRFVNLQNYKNYVASNIATLQKCNINQYSVEEKEEYTNYICMDQFDNYYIFKETNIGEYTLTLDTYTLEQEKFNEKYEKATNNEKVAMNITKFFQMINMKDYKSAYSLLSSGFKNRNFTTQEKFEQYIKSKFYNYNDVNLVNFSDKISGVFTYYIELSNKEKEESPKIKMNIIMELLEGSNYQLSFEIVD